MAIVAPYTEWYRFFGCGSGLEKGGKIAHEMGRKAVMSAWLSSDLAANEQQILCLIAVAQAGQADMLIVGSEALLRGDLTESQVIDYINRVKQAAPGIPVATADVYGELLAYPNVMAAGDVVLANFYPYWEGVDVNYAIASLNSQYQQLVAASGGKQVLVSETGWPSAGNQIGKAIPSPENASFHFLNFVSWARAEGVDYFYFEAFDESWKAAPEGPQGAHWGVWDKDGNLKPGMQAVFDGQTIPDNWSGLDIPGGPGTPEILFTFVPAYGSYDWLDGQIWHIRPADYRVAIYIKVNGGWWTKPTWATPLTTINPDGSWTCDITTGGYDQEATEIAAYLVPNGYNPPSLGGDSSLPAELAQNAVAVVDVTRNP
jgi:exo-beta-1,3-glucanase (GH17 family)